jgi:hypothetical protein
MSAADLEAVRAELANIGPSETIATTIPVATFVQEAFNLSRMVAEPAVRAGLLEVGLEAARLDALPRAVGALEEAEARWRATSPRSLPDTHLENEKAAAELRARVIQVAKFALRRDRVAQGAIAAIQQGRGLDDLTSDLGALAKLLETHADAFASNRRFDRAAAGRELLRLRDALRQGEHQQADPLVRTAAKLLRDRAFTHLHRLTSEVREAAAVAFASDLGLLRRFQSPWLLRKSRGRAPMIEPAEASDAEVETP